MIDEAMHHATHVLSFIGNISLNISFVLYLIVYIPQIIHNQKVENIAQLSFGLHLLLFSSYSFDLVYGFASQLPWQYKTVSTVGLLLVTVQHIQLIKFFVNKQLLLRLTLSIFLIILNCIAIYYFFIIQHRVLDSNNTFIVGTAARICGLIYCFPQIIKNCILKSANAISLKYIYLNLVLALLDTCSSWSLNWGWPNKVAAPCSVVIMLLMLYQINKYEHRVNLLIYNSKGMQTDLARKKWTHC
jgi:uncharacterized membrane protein (UPF0136 family)